MAGKKRTTSAAKPMNVSVAMLGEPLKVYELPAKSTVQAALDKAGIAATAGEIRVDAANAKLTDSLKHGQIVTVVQNVQGG